MAFLIPKMFRLNVFLFRIYENFFYTKSVMLQEYLIKIMIRIEYKKMYKKSSENFQIHSMHVKNDWMRNIRISAFKNHWKCFCI